MTARHGTAVWVGDWTPGSPEWHDARRATVNGSEIAAVLGLSPFESPFSLWHRKAGDLGEVYQTDEMYWGTLLENVIRQEWNRRHLDDGISADRTGLWRHTDRTWQGGSPDGLVWPLIVDHQEQPPDALLECKCASYGKGWGEPGTDEIPVHYRAQCLWYLDVFGLDVCHVAVLIAGSEYREYQVKHNSAELEPMRIEAQAFLDTLDARQLPPLDGHDATYQAVRELHPDIDPIRVELPPAVGRSYLDALAGYKDAETEKRRAAAAVIDAMGSAETALYLGQKIATRIAPRTDGEPPYLRAVNGAADHHRRPTP